MMHIAYVPLGGFLLWLHAGWRFPRDIAQPMAGNHGLWSCLMEMEPSVPEVPKRKRAQRSLTAYRRALT